MSSSSSPVREGDLLAGKYRVERVLGSGGMGIVVAARHEKLDQLVAIKFVRDEALGNEEAVQRFLREARAAVKLKSEHVARVLDVGTLESGAPFMVMEYLEGSDLGAVIDGHGAMSIEDAADWIMQACEAVAEAHAAGIVHRDLKPENLFLANTVGGATRVKVLDFGVSKSGAGSGSELSGLTQTRAMLGSPLYMSPEQMRSSRDVDARADVWALGVVLFQLLTARMPFEAETMPELCLKVVTERPMSLAALRPDAPPGMVALIDRCLEKERDKRFANAAELASALEPFAHPASRALAERARAAMAGGSWGPDRRPSLVGSNTPRPLNVTPTLASGPLGPQTPVTAAGWGSEGMRRSTPGGEPPRPRSRVLFAVVGAGVLTFVVALVALRSAGRTDAQAGAQASGSAGASGASGSAPPAPSNLGTTEPVAPAVTVATPAPSAPALALLPSASPQSSAALARLPTVSLAPSMGRPSAPSPGPLHAQPVGRTGPQAGAAAGAAAGPGAPAAPTVPDDDIPALR